MRPLSPVVLVPCGIKRPGIPVEKSCHDLAVAAGLDHVVVHADRLRHGAVVLVIGGCSAPVEPLTTLLRASRTPPCEVPLRHSV